MKFFKAVPIYEKKFKQVYEPPSFYREFLEYLNQLGYTVPSSILDQQLHVEHEENEQLTQLFHKIYQNHEENYNLYLALEGLLDMDEKVLLWRYRHVAMVERMIGRLKGTGGSSGVDYLSSTLNKKVFPELWSVRNILK